jgi:hypothetical protein
MSGEQTREKRARESKHKRRILYKPTNANSTVHQHQHKQQVQYCTVLGTLAVVSSHFQPPLPPPNLTPGRKSISLCNQNHHRIQHRSPCPCADQELSRSYAAASRFRGSKALRPGDASAPRSPSLQILAWSTEYGVLVTGLQLQHEAAPDMDMVRSSSLSVLSSVADVHYTYCTVRSRTK